MLAPFHLKLILIIHLKKPVLSQLLWCETSRLFYPAKHHTVFCTVSRHYNSRMLRVFVEVSDNYLWALKPFIYLFQTYWSEQQPVVIGGFAPPPFELPDNFRFHQIAKHNFPANKWSDGMLKFFLDNPTDEHFVFMLADYWLSRTVDVRGVQACYDYIKDRPNVLRIDLSADRLYAGGMRDVESYGCYDVVETPNSSPYQMSIQAAIWHRKNFVKLLQQGKSAWEVEIHTKPPEQMRVLGTRQWPVRYANALLKGQLDFEQVKRIPQPHLDRIIQWIPENLLHK